MITKRYKLYKNFGKCLEISNGTVKALVTVDIGPRVIYYGFKGANMFYEDIDRLVDKGGDFFDKNFKEGEKWYLYGGHRIWKAEEDLLSYVPDNYPVRVDRLENGALFTPALQKLTSLQQTMKVTMDEDGTLTVEESLRNEGSEPVELSVWGLSVLRQGGTEIIPLNTADTGLLPQQNMVFWPYNDKKDIEINKKEYQDIIDYLNYKTNSNFILINEYKKLINNILKKYTTNDIKTVIDKKTSEWINNPKMKP